MQSNGYVNNPNMYPQVQPVQQPASNPVQYSAPQYQGNGQAPVIPPSASGVNIQIISPSVYGNNGASTPPLHPYNPIYNYPPANNNINNNFAPVNYAQGQPPVPAAQPPTAVAPPVAEDKKEKTKKKKVVPLTNEYVKTLENYLNNPNEQARVMGVKQVLQRFKEDESRKHDAALTALMNKAMQDKSSNVRSLAMAIPAAGYASGDDKTIALLQRAQQSKANYNEDALLASQALMKIAETYNQVEVEVPQNS